MSTISLLILIASVICFFVGLASPEVFQRWFGKNINRKRIAMIFGGLIVASFITTGVFASPSDSKPKDKPAPVQEVKKEAPPAPKVETKEETKTEEVAFQTVTKDDSTLEKGQTKVSQEGRNGVKEIKYKVTYTDDKETGREKISETITVQPVNKIVLNGTKEQVVTPKSAAPVPSSNCDPNYSGACVPIASDVDCAGGSGNGPAYVRGPVYVIGADIYDLDRDGNGVGCEN